MMDSIQDHIMFLDDLFSCLIASCSQDTTAIGGSGDGDGGSSSSSSTMAEPRTRRKTASNARLGYCQHPKHQMYRLDASMTGSPLGATPRRGRPPKGSKASDLIVPALTIRPLPKRLEKVVGFKDICVCLTCLKRTDLDREYLSNPAYVGPQHKRVALDHMRP
ncbi:hypothetical protein BX666DRAFT_2118333 [Dichotomocladium elegans]|nr:hypothetical protein BX666DRAFT_2118333 [Dichotomocladium elegans]